MEGNWHIYKEFARLGKLLFQQGLVSLTAGNLSIMKDNIIYITSSGSMLGDLRPEDIVAVPIQDKGFTNTNILNKKKPSIEIVVHKSIYESTDHKAVVHAHPPAAIAFSFENKKIVLADSEGKFYIPEVPVVAVNGGIASPEVATGIPSYLNKYPAVLIKGHGVFAAAGTLIEACATISTIEFSSKILLYRKKIFDSLK